MWAWHEFRPGTQELLVCVPRYFNCFSLHTPGFFAGNLRCKLEVAGKPRAEGRVSVSV